MCELFASNSRDPIRLNAYLKEFFEHSAKHPHGWGLATFDEDENVQVEKEPIQATKSIYLKERLQVPVEGRMLLGHIRYATIGNLKYANCHPFTGTDNSGRRWTMVHNGTIFKYDPLNSYVKKQLGETDSERIFLYLLDQVNEKTAENGGKPLNKKERFQLLDSIVSEMAEHNKLNLLIYDGEYLYVHTNCAGTLHYLQKEDHVLFATVPIGSDTGKWKPVPMTQLLSYRNGVLQNSGTVHGHEYIENPKDMQLLYRIFSNL